MKGSAWVETGVGFLLCGYASFSSCSDLVLNGMGDVPPGRPSLRMNQLMLYIAYCRKFVKCYPGRIKRLSSYQNLKCWCHCVCYMKDHHIYFTFRLHLHRRMPCSGMKISILEQFLSFPGQGISQFVSENSSQVRPGMRIEELLLPLSCMWVIGRLYSDIAHVVWGHWFTSGN